MISGLEGRGGLFSEGRKVLPHSIDPSSAVALLRRVERQLGPETLPSTAPEDSRLREGGLPCPPSRAAQARRAGLPVPRP